MAEILGLGVTHSPLLVDAIGEADLAFVLDPLDGTRKWMRSSARTSCNLSRVADCRRRHRVAVPR